MIIGRKIIRFLFQTAFKSRSMVKLMILTLLMGIQILNSCSSSSEMNMKEGQKTMKTAVKYAAENHHIFKNLERRQDTLLNTEKFLVLGHRAMKLDCIYGNGKNQVRKSKGDTLFCDSEAVLLGNKRYAWITWIYVKYKSAFRFSQFRVDSIAGNNLKLPDLKDVKAPFCRYMDENEWKDYIKSECVKQGVNFAGHYTIVDWGCGMCCQNMCIVNRLTGKVSFPDIPDSHIDGYYGADYQKNSRMIRTNVGVLEEDLPGYYQPDLGFYPEVYEWENERAIRLE
jgi:hypothetical protein